MSKAVFVMDMPEKRECRYCEIYETCRQRWKPCPLKPIPEKKPEYLSINSEKGYCDGWNACIDAICGGE